MRSVRWQRRLRQAIFGIVLTATLLALFYQEENWRAARNWSACRQALADRGEILDFPTLEGLPLAPERNLASLPFFTRWGSYRVDSYTGRAVFTNEAPSSAFTELPSLTRDLVHSFPGTQDYDLAAWQQYYRRQQPGVEPLDPTREVLRALDRFQPTLAELAAARDAMPDGQFRREYDLGARIGDSFGAAAEIKLNYTLMLRASAQLAAGHSPEALHDIELALWLRKATCGEPPLLLPLMVGTALLSQNVDPIKNGLAQGDWTSEELARLQGELQRINLLADYAHAMRGERAWDLGSLGLFLQNRPNKGKEPLGGGNWVKRLPLIALRYGPRGWLTQNKVALSNLYDQRFLAACNASAHRIYPERLRAAEQAAQMNPSWLHPGTYLLSAFFYFMGNQLSIVAETQSQVDELVVTCALKRYALAHGKQYPAALPELAPQYLDRVPTNVFDGTPMHYQATPDGRYQLAAGRTK